MIVGEVRSPETRSAKRERNYHHFLRGKNQRRERSEGSFFFRLSSERKEKQREERELDRTEDKML